MAKKVFFKQKQEERVTDVSSLRHKTKKLIIEKIIKIVKPTNET